MMGLPIRHKGTIRRIEERYLGAQLAHENTGVLGNC